MTMDNEEIDEAASGFATGTESIDMEFYEESDVQSMDAEDLPNADEDRIDRKEENTNVDQLILDHGNRD